MSTMSQRSHLTDSGAWRVVGSVNGSETPKYERYSSPTTHSLSYRQHGFNSDYPKPAPWCRSVCSPTDGICQTNIRHRRDRREWVTEHVNWRRNEWSNVLFLKSPVFLFIRIIGVFSSGGTVAILRPIVVPYAAEIGDDFILMDDNCRPHRANLVEDFLFEEGIVQMEWPACSPDMNPTEHVWDALGRQIAGRKPTLQTLQEQERALLEE
ncbi:transposable element Tcb2 transposase [Trichonephila clavipes]|uniref:Transposable element Tcb2 transposase n=1 Tax=Trichonephila clavipes TaxID=2585209 RepID=A0A8X6WKU9_TRICX|nr:transposable element Tcb2 transposase [Trichonephila clavipes]